MNKVYKIIWSHARNCYVVVSEIAKNHGKNNVRTIVEGLAAHTLARTGRWALPLVTAGLLMQGVPGFASTITDKSGNNIVNGTGVHNIYAQELVTNSNVDLAVNRFRDYKITQGDIANMYFRLNKTGTDAANLVNLVKNRIDVQGTVNAIKGNKIGGNLYFISPNGMAIGNTGVINAGKFVALAPTSSYFSGDLGTEGIWNSNANLAYQFHNDIANFGKRDEEGTFKELKDLQMNPDANIEIAGRINARSGIVLGASKIVLQNGAALQSRNNLDFTGLVNAKDASGNVLTAASFDVGAVTLNPAADESGDIILRATAANEYTNTPVIPTEQYNAVFETSNSATVEVAGSVESDGGVDISADAKTTFDNTTWNGWNITDIGQNLAAQLGFNWEASWADKTNTASVTLGKTGSIKAGGDVSLQADATVDVKIISAAIGEKEQDTSTAIPVIAVGVAKVKNKALVDVAGGLASEGDISLAASASTTASIITKADIETVDTDGHEDKGNAIYVGLAWLTGDNIAQVSIRDKKDSEGNSTAITAEGDFSAEASSSSDITLRVSATGVDETFASTSIAVMDYDSAANVDIERSVEAKSINASAENEIGNLYIESSNSNGEGDENYAGSAERIKWELKGKPNAGTIAGLIKNKFNLSGMTNGGKLQGLENAFTTAQEYVTAGAAVAVVDNSNTAHVSVAPGVNLEATGPATEKKDGKDVPAGDVTLSANTHMDSVHHSIAGEANKMDDDTGSKVTVAAGVLYSSIENDAVVELQSDTKTHKGVTLESANGSVNLKAETVQVYDPLEPLKAIPERLEKLYETLKKLGKEFPELTNLHAETVTTKTQLENGEIKEDEARARFANYSVSFGNFLSNEAQNLIALDKGVQLLIDEISYIFSPDCYTNYYVRSYTVDSTDQGGKNVAVGASLNIAKLHDKGIVSLGEGTAITAGKDIKIDATTDTNVVSATGNGGEYFSFSESNGSGVGASVAVQDFSGDSLILSGKNVTMNAKGTTENGGNVALNADNKMAQTSIILSAGKADSKLSASGSVNVLTGDSNSLVLVDDESTVKADGDFNMTATNDTTVTNIVGGLALGSSKTNASIGAGVAVNSLGVNSLAVMGDNGTDASVEPVKTDTDDFKKKTIEEQNKIKAQNTLVNARKLAKERATVKKMDTDFNLSNKKLNESLGAKTTGSAKGSVSAQNVYVTGNSDGTINTVALEGASNSENHSGFDTVNKWGKEGAAFKDQSTTAMKNIVGSPLSALDKVFDKSNISADKTWDFSGKQAIQAPNNDPSTTSFNAAVAGSVSWNKVNSETASVIDNVTLNLDKTASGKLLNAASDDVFSGAWSGAAAVNWFTGGNGSQANQNAHKGALGTALAVNNLKRDVDAVISNSEISKAATVENTAIKNGAEAAAALGLAVTNDSQGTGTNASVAFGLSLNKSDSGVHALMIDDTSTNTNSTGTDITNRAYDGDIQVAGGVDFAFANSADGGRAVAAGITAAVSEIKNDIQSGIQGGTYTGVKDMKVAGEEAITQVNAAVAVGVTTSEKGFTGTGSLAYADLDNVNHGYISGTNEIDAKGEVSVTDRDISGTTDNVYKEYLKQRKTDPTGESYLSSDTKDKLGANSGSAIVNVAVGVSASKSHTVGAAITVGKIANKFSSDITNNKKLTADAVKAAADVHTNIVSVGAGVSVSTKNFGGAGSLSFNDLDQDNIVSITGNRNGTATDSGITANTVSGTAKNTSHIVNVTGDFAGGKNAVGLGIAYNRMDDTTGVYAANNQIQAKDAAKGVDVSLDATNDAYALALSLGAAATYKDDGTVAAHGNFGINRGHNDTVAVIGEDKDGNKDTTAAKRNTITNASSVKATATDKTSKTTIAGAAELAIKDTTVALGIGVALTESDKGSNAGDGRETLRAEINNADITTVKRNNTTPAISATATDVSKATTVAVGVGITKSSKIGAQGIGADANIFKNNTAGLKDTTIDKNGGSKAALVTAKADTSSTLNTGAAALQLSGPDSFLTGVVAVGVNRIKDTTTAGVTYTDKQTATSMNVGNLDISADSKGDITSVAMGASVAVKGTAAAGGSGSHNYIENNAAAKIEKADINSTGNVGVVARSDEAITNYAGVIDVAAGGQGVSAAIGITGSNNKISGNTSALIDNSKVVAKGSSSNKIKTKSGLKTDDTYLIDGAVTTNTWKSSKLQTGRQEEEKSGVVVDASATHAIASVMANGGVAVGESAGVSVAGVINLNDVEGSTTAKVLDSQINTKNTRSDVNVRAADYTNVAEFSGAASVGIGETAGVAAGFTGTTNDISRLTAAGVSTSSAIWNDTKKQYEITDTSKTKNTVYANNFAVTADAKQAMSAFNVTGAIAGSTAVTFETGDNVNTNKMNSSTVALVTNTTADYTKNAKVEASHEDRIYNLNVDAGAAISADLYSAAGSLNVGVGVVNEDSTVTADVENSSLKKADSSSSTNLSIGAGNKTTLEAQLVSVGAAVGIFSAGISSSIAVNNIDTKVTSRIAGSELTADTIKIDTANAVKVKDATGTGAGALLAGIGVGVDATTFNDTVSTIVDNSALKATNTLAVNTKTQREIESTVAGVGIGAAGIAVNVLAVTVNDGINSLGKSKDENGNDTSFSHTDTINKVLQSVNDHNNQDYSENFHGMTDAEKKEMKEKVKTNAKSGDNVNGTGVHTYVQNNSALEAANGALTVNNTELNDADLNGGSGSLGALQVNVADTVYHLNQLNDISVKDSTVKGASISLATQQGNVTGNKEDAIRVRTVQAGLGIVGVGVGYAGLTTKGNTGITVDHGVLNATNGDLTVKSTDAVQSKTNMIGVSAAGVAIPVSVAHNTNIANNFVNVKGGSTLSAATQKTQEGAGGEGNTAAETTPAYINLQTERTGRVAAKTVGVGVGGAAVVVNTAKAYDKSTSAVSVSGSNNSFTADAIRMEAVNAPVVKAEAGGTGVAVLGVSVMQSNAEAYSAAKVDVADNNKLLGNAVLAQAVIGKEGTDMTHAETHGTSGTIVSVAPNKAKAITETTASVSMGKETYKTKEEGEGEEKTTAAETNLALITQNNASRRAILGNTTIGLGVSIGTGDAKATGDDKSLITAKGGSSSDSIKLKNLKISAGGSNTAKGLADGDSGGLTAWGAAATITMKTKTTNTASLSGAWDVTENADIGSVQQVTAKGTSKTGAGGVLSVTWANSDNNVEMDSKTELNEGAQLNAGQSYVLAANKIVTGAYDGESWNNHMNVGGVIQIAPDIKSEQVMTSKANVVIGNNAKVTTAKGQVYDAYTDMDIYNKVEGKGGGVAENVYAYSDNKVTSTNKITVSEGAELEQKGEFEEGSDITLSSSDKIKMDLAAEAYTGGLEGTLKGQVDNELTRNNGVEVNGKLTSTHDINLYAGADADGSSSEVNIKELAEAHNNTMLSFYTSAQTNLDLKNNQQVKVGNTGSAVSIRNINVTADTGSETFKKETVKVYNLVASASKESKTVSNAPGTADISETNNNFVNVEGLLKTGIQNNVKIDITGALVPTVKDGDGQPVPVTAVDENGNTRQLPAFSVEVSNPGREGATTVITKDDITTGEMDYASQLGNQLVELDKLIQDYSTGKSDSTSLASYLGYVQQRQRIMDEMKKRGLVQTVTETDASGQTVTKEVLITGGITISYVEIPEIVVSGGSIIVRSDNLYGGGKLEANGKPQVEINNLSNAYMKLDGIRVGEDGGDIRFQGTSIASKPDGLAQIRELNKDKNKSVNFAELYSDTSTGNVSGIRVLNDNSGIGTRIDFKDGDKQGTYTAIPDVAVLGDLTNDIGDIRIDNRQGNITIGSGTAGKSANINGRAIQLIAVNGSVSQDYVDGIVNVGGNPQDMNRDEVNNVINSAGLDKEKASDIKTRLGLTSQGSDITKAEAGRIAGDSVYIAAADINVNGLIQSGFSKYEANIGADALSDENIQKYKNTGSEVTVQGRTMYKVNDGNKAVYDAGIGAYKYIVQVYYDPQSGGLVVEDIDTRGGKIYLTGRISSTGNGKILATDGGSEIAITNASSGNLTTGEILNNNIDGRISITDLAKNTWTEYSRTTTNSMSLAAYEKYLKLSDADKESFASMTVEEKAAKLGLTADQVREQVSFGAAGIGYNTGAEASGSYSVKEGLRYNWTLGQETGTTNYYHKKTSTLFWGGLDIGTSESKLAEQESSTPHTTGPSETHDLGKGTFIDTVSGSYSDGSTALVDTPFGAILESQVTSSSRTVTGEWKESGDWWALWSNPTYHTTWTTKTGSTQSYTFSLKADNPIALGFLGQENGSISVSNTNTDGGSVNLDGNIRNNTKDATLTVQSAGGGIVQKSGTTITTGKADLQAKDNIENIHITSMGERVATGEKDSEGKDIYTTNDGVVLSAVSTNGGNIDVDVMGGVSEGQALPGNVVIQKLQSQGQDATGQSGDVTLKAQGNISQTETDVTVKGQSIRLTSVNGSIGTSNQAIVVDSSAEAFGLSEDSAGVNAEAKSDIRIAEKNGDMRVGSVVSHEGDVYLEAKDGRLTDALPQVDDGNNMDEEDLVHHWIDAGLIAGTEDYEGAYIRSLKQDAANYKARVEAQYAEFKSGTKEISLRQQFTKKDGSGTTYESAEAYLADDVAYQSLPDSEKPAYAAKVGQDFALFVADESIRGKFTKADGTFYTSAGEYLAADAEYQQLVKNTLDKTNPYVRDVNEKFAKFKNGDDTYKDMFTKADGTSYDTVSQYLLADETYQGYIKEQNDYSLSVFEEFSHFTNNRSNGALSDMFTLPSGKTYDSADAYLRDDAAYQAIVEKYEHPDFAWTKDQLLYAVRNAIVNKESGVSAETQSKIANVQGKNVTLVAQGIGLNTNQTTEIKASELGGGSETSIAKMKLLSNADATDVTMKDGNGNTLLFTVQDGKQVAKAYDAKGKEVATDGVIDTFVIGNLSPLGVYATGKVDVTAISDNVFIAGRSNDKAGFAPLNVGKIMAGGSDGSGNVNSDVRLYTQEGIYNAADQLGQNEGNIHAKDLVAYGGTKDIGTKEKPVTVSLTGDLLTANADGNVYIKNIKGDDKLRVGSVYAGDTVSLDSAKGFAMTTNPDYTLAYLNAGKVLEMKTNPTDGVIGDAANPIRILNNAGTPENYGGELTNNGMLINLAGKDAYVKGVNGTRGNATTMRLGLVEMAGDFVASSESYLEAGAVRLADAEHDGINGKVDATGNVNLEAAKDVIVNGPVDSASGDISVTAGNDARINHEVNAASGGIRITANNEAKINNTVATGSNTGTIAISGVNGVTLNGLVSAGNLNLVEEAYAGGGPIMLTSEKGSVIQGETGVLKAASVTTASGNAILLTNAGNTFRNYTANGVERDKTDEQGNVVTDDAGNAVKETVIDGSVTVYAHAGNNLNAAVTDTVYGDVELKNLDEGALTVTSDIVAKEGKNGELGSVTFRQKGDILVEGAVKADGLVTEAVADGVGSIINKKDISAQDVQVETVEGNIDLQGNVVSLSNVDVRSESGDITAKGNISAGNDITAQSASGKIMLNGKAMEAGNNLTVITSAVREEGSEPDDKGRIQLGNVEGTVSAGRNITVTAKDSLVHVDGAVTAAAGNVSVTTATGAIELAGDVKATVDSQNGEGGNVTATSQGGAVTISGSVDAAKELTANTTGDGTVTVGSNLEGKTVTAGENVALTAEDGQIHTLGSVTAGKNVSLSAQAGTIDVSGKVVTDAGDIDIITYSGSPKSGNITVTADLNAGHDINVESDTGAIAMTGDIDAVNDIRLSNNTGTIETNGYLDAGNNVEVTSSTGDIALNGDVDAGNDVIVTGSDGNITFTGDVRAENDVKVTNANGDTELRGKVSTGNDILISSGTGAVFAYDTVAAGRDLTVASESGMIGLGGDTDAGRDIAAISETGTILLLGDINAGQDVKAKTGGDGSIMLNNPFAVIFDAATGDVHAGRNVSLETENTGLLVAGKVTTETGDVIAATKKGIIEFVGNMEAGRNIEATITEGDDSSYIQYMGTAVAGNDITATTNQGDIKYDKSVSAGNSITALTDNGDIVYDATVTAGDSVLADTLAGNITVGEDIVAQQGNVTVTTAAGSVIVGENDGTGNIRAGSDVSITTEKGDATVKTSIASDSGSVTVKSLQGNINVGEVPVENAISAKENIDLYVADGVITVNGKTETEQGDITVQARDEDTDRNIVIAQNGKLVSGRDLTLHTYNGGIEVTDDTTAKRNLTVIVENKGDVTFANNVEVTGTVSADVKEGNVAIGEGLKAGQDISVKTGEGNIEVGAEVSADGSVKATTVTGNIAVGENVTAGKDVELTVGSGNVTIDDEVTAGSNVIMTSGVGDISVGADVTAMEGNVTMASQGGDITVGADVSAGKAVIMDTAAGNIRVEDDVTAGEKVTLTTGTGNITVGNAETGTGNVMADGDVTIGTGKGDVNIVKTIASDNGSVSVKSQEGNILVGNNGPDVDTVIAKQNIDLYVAYGVITVNGKTETEQGDITVQARDEDTDRNIVITQNGKLVSGRDLTLHTYNGGIEVTDDTTAKRNLTVIVENKGDVTFANNVEVTGNVFADVKEGNVAIGEGLKAGQAVSVKTGEGNLSVGADVTAMEGNVTMASQDGDITVGADVSAGKAVTMDTAAGNIRVEDDVTAGEKVTLTTGTGNIRVGNAETGTGNVRADGDVTIETGKGDVNILKTVASDNGSVSVKSQEGNILVGNNGPDVDTVTAKENVKLEAADGKIEIYGKTSTETGDITLKAANKEYIPGEDGQNIIIDDNGQVVSGRDVNLIAKNGDLHVTDAISAQRDVNATTETQGDILLDNDLSVSRDLKLQTETGDINVKGTAKAGRNISLLSKNVGDIVADSLDAENNATIKTETGNITADSVTAGNDATLTAKTGDITAGSVNAGNDALLTTVEGNVDVKEVSADRNATIATETGDITADSVTAGNDATLTAKTGDITAGSVNAGNDALLTTVEGNVDVKVVSADHNATIATEKGDITADSVTAKNDAMITAETGDIIANKVEAGTNALLSAAQGNITAQKVTAGQNATVKTKTGDITAGSVNAGNDTLITTVEGNVDAKEVSADHNATIATEKGNIAENSVTAGNDATLTAKTGDITAGSVNAGNEALITTVEGNVDAKEVSADYNATIATEKGDITTDSVTAGNNIHVENGNGTTKAGTLTAGNKVTVKNGDGQIIIGTADGANVSLTNAGQNGTVKADRVLAETRGNSNGTGAADVLLGGSSVSVKSVVNKGGSSPLAISTVGASADQAMKDIRLGQQNADGSYSGGISSASGAVIQQVWTDTGLIYAEGDTDLHISKAVANDKLHVANDEVSVAVYGRTPTHDGETIVYWTNNSRNKPNENMQAWFNRDYYGAGRWLWIDLKGNGAVTMHNGEMIDYNYYRKLYGDYPSLTDMMRKRLDIEISDNEMVYYDRLGLIRYDAPSVQNAKGDEIETD